MNTGQLNAVDLLIGVLTVAGWLGSGVAAAARRHRIALALLAAAVLASAARVASVVALSRAGWWFVAEKVVIGVPLLIAGTAVALVVAVPRLTAAVRGAESATGSAPATRAVAKASPAVVVPVLSAGYAAAAGLLVTVLHGHPATWGAGLVATALVGAATPVTWQVLARPVPSAVLRGGTAATVAVAMAGAAATAVSAVPTASPGTTHHHPAVEARSVSDLRGPATPEPGRAVRRYTLTARTATITLSSGRRVEAWTFDGQVPGPHLTAEVGDLVEVTLRNADIGVGATLHWHGYDVPAGEDGVPGLTQDAVRPGQEFVYRFRANQVGTYWYHTHSMSHRGVRMGLYGTLVVMAPRATGPGLDVSVPVHTFGGTVVFGNHDQFDERRVTPGVPVRLRLINTDSRPHRFTLAGTAYRIVAIDGGDLSGPTQVNRVGLHLSAGGRYDLAFAMPEAVVTLLADGDRGRGLRLWPARGTGAGPDAQMADTSGWPDLDPTRYGTAGSTPIDARNRFDRDFTLVLDRGLTLADGRPRFAFTVNGRAHPDIPTQYVREGDLVRLAIVNRSFAIHPWHLHGHHVLVLARDGRPPTGSPLWLDTFDVLPGETWQVAFRADNPGVWANHCHDLDHAEAGMMLHLAYDGIATSSGGHH
ncbi:MAG TPA: multicopper oxidase family protein [Micromonosporaceae bacterium]